MFLPVVHAVPRMACWVRAPTSGHALARFFTVMDIAVWPVGCARALHAFSRCVWRFCFCACMFAWKLSDGAHGPVFISCLVLLRGLRVCGSFATQKNARGPNSWGFASPYPCAECALHSVHARRPLIVLV